ncbi:NAD-dependent protein deacylase [Deferribacterales bacterium RsTz2092]|nr:NAD-dependent protein deacylase [Deferribacterales bacterium]
MGIVVLTGAGISAESGIATFRDANGLWAEHRVEDVATPDGYERNPLLVLDFYNKRRRELKSVKPNPAHLALAKLEQGRDDVLVVTQNVDNLHEQAGTKSLIHMHGELNKIRCTECETVFDCYDDITLASKCEKCGTEGTLRPHIVWFGEMPFMMDEISYALHSCELFISIGTSGNVYPAAGFVQSARSAGAHTVELNLEPSLGASMFKEKVHGKAGEVVPVYVNKILSGELEF